MAATVSSPWGKPGAWALDAEEHEDELRQQAGSPKTANTSGEAEFPSLAAAASTKQPKKKKNQALSLAEFATFSAAAKPSQPTQSLTHDELLNLPTGPRQRSAEELDRSRLGGGFKSYGVGSRNGDDSSNSRWGGGNSRVSNRDRDRDSSREIAPSRADEIDDWSKTKKSPAGNGYERRERGSFFDSQSKADESDNWGSNKQTETRRFGGANSGFERRGSFDSLSRDRYGGSSGGGAADSDSWGRKREDSTESGISRRKLLLQPRSVPVNDNGISAKPKGSSPFGDARPREAVLAEKGKDWKEIDEKLDSARINNGREIDKGENGNLASAKWSFGSGRGAPRVERSWRKPEISATERSERSENGDESENGHAAEVEVTQGN